MNWRGRLNQQAVTSGSQYSPSTVSSLRTRDIQNRYDQGVSSAANQGTGNMIQQPVTGNEQQPPPEPPGPNQQATTNLSSSLKDTVQNYIEARNKADRAKQDAMALKVGTGATTGAIAGGGGGAFTGAAMGMLGSMLGQAFGPKPDMDRQQDVENYSRALGIYDTLNSNYDMNPQRDYAGNPISRKDYLTGAFHEYYNIPGTMDQTRKNKLLRDLGISSEALSSELGYQIPDLNTLDYEGWNRQAVGPQNYGIIGYDAEGNAMYDYQSSKIIQPGEYTGDRGQAVRNRWKRPEDIYSGGFSGMGGDQGGDFGGSGTLGGTE